MSARHILYTLILFIAALLLMLIQPASAAAVNWNSDTAYLSAPIHADQ